MKKRIFAVVLALVLLLVALMLAQALLIPSRYDNREGHLLCGYEHATDAHDVIFVGDCEIYEGIVPAVLYEQYGITSQFDYIMNYRAEQGYTVIQSQPLYWWDVNDQIWFQNGGQNIFTLGVNDFMVKKFQEYDRYFKIIADYGFVRTA